MSRTEEGLRALGPNGKRKFIDALAAVADEVLDDYKIDTPLRVSHFWSQISHECAGFKSDTENLNYSARRLRQVFPKYFRTDAEAAAAAGNPQAIANKVYGGRLGNTAPGDGWKYRGRGPLQLTGKANYAEMGKALGIDLVGNPDLAADPRIGLQIACEFWKARGLNKLADANDIRAITKKINGGYNGLADRKANFVIAWRIWGDGVDRPKPKPLTKSTEMAAGGAAATAAPIGVGAAWEAGKAAAGSASDMKEIATDAGGLVGFDGSMALLIGAAIIMAAGIGYLLYRRYRRNRDEDV